MHILLFIILVLSIIIISYLSTLIVPVSHLPKAEPMKATLPMAAKSVDKSGHFRCPLSGCYELDKLEFAELSCS